MKRSGFLSVITVITLCLSMSFLIGSAYAGNNKAVRDAYESYLRSYNEFKNAVEQNCGETTIRVYAEKYYKELENYKKLKGDAPSKNAEQAPTPGGNVETRNDAAVKMNSSYDEIRQSVESVSKELGLAKTDDEIDAAIVKLNLIIATSDRADEVIKAKRELGNAYMIKKDYTQALEVFNGLLKEKDGVDKAAVKKSIEYAESLQKNVISAPASAAAGSAGAVKKDETKWWSNPVAKISSKLSELKSSLMSGFTAVKSKATSFFASDKTGTGGLKRIESEEPAVAADENGDSKESAKKHRPFITGAFFQLSECYNNGTDYPVQYWLTELGAMQNIGMDTAIIQYNLCDGINYSEATERFLTAADQLGMKVFIGTALNESNLWYTVHKVNPVWLAGASKTIAAYTRVLVRQFKGHGSFVGVYIPNEDNTIGLPGPVGKFYGTIVKAVKEEKPELLTLISPFTCLQPGRAKSFPKIYLEKYFKTMLSNAKVDICAWQDGVGGTREQLNKVDNDLGAIVKACDELGITVWANAEVFHRTTPLSEAFSAEATDFATMKTQIDKEYKYVSKMICFDFNHYFSPNIGSPTAKTLYENYKAYFDENSESK